MAEVIPLHVPDAAIPVRSVETETGRRQGKHRQGLYLKSQPLDPLQAAARVGGSSLAVFIAARHRADVTGAATVTLSSDFLARFGVDKHAKGRALAGLEDAGLITVERASGRSPRITLKRP
jgi:hypothetical protein